MTTHYYIGHATDIDIRTKASSGGIGTAITKYLLSLPDYNTSVTFVFDSSKCMYVPKLIHTGEEINVCGSIYQDIDVVNFVRKNITEVKGGMVVTCPPCQVMAMRQLLKRNDIECFILSYCCSGQTTVEGTWCYYKFLGIEKSDIQFMQYRGNGWPSGIQIQTKDRKIFHANYTEPWVTIHRSGLFRPKRCFYCKRDTGRNADIALSDPWIDEYKKNDTIGNTLFLVNTELGENVLKEMTEKKLIAYILSNYDEYAIAQRPNIYKELRIKGQEKFIKRQQTLTDNNHYFHWATRSVGNMRRHLLILRLVKLLSSTHNMSNFINKRFNKLILIIRSKIIARKLSGSLKHFNISGGGNNK